MAVQNTQVQKNAIKKLTVAASSMKAMGGSQQRQDGSVLRDYLKTLRDRTLHDDELMYPHDLPMRALFAVVRMPESNHRLASAKALLSTSHPPTPTFGQDKALYQAIICGAENLLPLLHEKGFRLTSMELNSVASEIGELLARGRWCHLEIIAPNILTSNGNGIVRELFAAANAPDSISLASAFELLNQLTPPPNFKEQVSALLAEAAWRKKWKLRDSDNVLTGIAKLLDLDWLDLDAALEASVGSQQEESFAAFIAQVRGFVLDRQAPTTMRPGSLPRL